MAVAENDALFSLLGTTYGGDGRATFGLPDMRGRIPLHAGSGPGLTPRTLGQKGGSETVTLTASQIGNGHTLQAGTAVGNQSSPTGHALASDSADTTYSNEAPAVAMNNASVGLTGGGGAHENRAPTLAVNCAIALNGIYPSRQ
jgi:microcystin-dependent protein